MSKKFRDRVTENIDPIEETVDVIEETAEESVEEIPHVEAEVLSQQKKYKVVNAVLLNLRAQPNVNANRIGLLAQDQVYFGEEIEGTGWVRIGRGFAMAEFLEVQNG